MSETLAVHPPDAAGWKQISHRIPGRSASGEPGPTLVSTSRNTLIFLVILTRLRCEWVPDRRPYGPCPGLRFRGVLRGTGGRGRVVSLPRYPRDTAGRSQVSPRIPPDDAGWIQISHRIPGRSASGEPGPTRIPTCRNALILLAILTPLQGEWGPDRRPFGPCPGLRLRGRCEAREAAGGSHRFRDILGILREDRASRRASTQMRRDVSTSLIGSPAEEPGPTRIPTCRNALNLLVILTPLRGEWVPDRRPFGPGPGLRFRGCCEGREAAGGSHRFRDILGILREDRASFDVSTQMPRHNDRSLHASPPDAAGWKQISHRIPGRSDSGEPGPTLIPTCRNVLTSPENLTLPWGEWVPDRRPYGPCPGLRLRGCCEGREAAGGLYRFPNIPGILREDRTSLDASTQMSRHDDRSLGASAQMSRDRNRSLIVSPAGAPAESRGLLSSQLAAML